MKGQLNPMIFQRLISSFPAQTRFSSQPQSLHGLTCHPSVKFSYQSSKPFSKITEKCDSFSGTSGNFRSPTRVLDNAVPRLLGNLGEKFGFSQVNSLASSLKCASFIHSIGQKEFETGMDNGRVETKRNSGLSEDSNRRLNDMNRNGPPVDTGRNVGFVERLSRRLTDAERNRAPFEMSRDSRPFGRDIGAGESGRNTTSMNFVRGIMKDNLSDMSQSYRSGVEQNADIVHIKLMRNNTFVTVTDSKGNKKARASAGCLAEMKGGPKVSKYAAEATAEHVGRIAKSMGLKSVVMKVNGFTFFKRKKLAILSFRDGYTHSRSDRNPIVYIEDTTRKPHNGCRLRKQRRV